MWKFSYSFRNIAIFYYIKLDSSRCLDFFTDTVFPWIISSLEVSHCHNAETIWKFPHFPLSKKNSFRGNYSRKYGTWKFFWHIAKIFRIVQDVWFFHGYCLDTWTTWTGYKYVKNVYYKYHKCLSYSIVD